MARQVNTILALRDRMSGPLARISGNVTNVSTSVRRANAQFNNWGRAGVRAIDNMIGRTASLAKSITTGIGGALVTAGAGLGAKELMDQVDSYASIQARLKLINDGQQTVEQFNQKIFESAQRTRSEYTDTAGVVAKLGVVAGGAFKSNNEILQFTEALNKSFQISGASTMEQTAAMYQLTQAMGAGKLQGDEYRSIIENAPMLAQAIAKQMGVTMGELKDMSGDGMITADIIKEAVFNSMDAVNQKYKEMPLTFAQTVTQIRNQVQQDLRPTFQNISNWLNSEQTRAKIKELTNGIAEAIPRILSFAAAIYNFVASIVNFYQKNQTFINTILIFVGTIYAVIKVIAILKTVFMAINTIWLVLNGTIMITPLGWIILAIAAVVAIGYLLYKNWDLIVKKAKEFWNWLKELGGRVVEFGAKLKNNLANALGKIVDKFKAIVQWGKDALKAVGDFFAGGGDKVGSGKGTKGKPPVGPGMQKFALGGIATKPSIFGEAGPEIAIPLNNSTRSQKLLSQANSLIGGGSSGINISLNISGTYVGEKEYWDKIWEHGSQRIVNTLQNI